MASLDPGFWRGKRVLLTGHTGFKGSWAAIWLAGLGAEVTGVALSPDQAPSLFDLAGVAGLVDSLLVDLRDEAAVNEALAGRTFDLALHMAAQPIVRTAIAAPVATFASNVMGTVHLLQALRAQRSLTAALVVTSDKVYANAETGRAFAEADALGGKDPYSASKAATEIAVASFARSYFEPAGVPLATARGGNVIGGGDFPGTGSSPTSSAPPAARSRWCCVIPKRRGPGSTFSTVWQAISSICRPFRANRRRREL